MKFVKRRSQKMGGRKDIKQKKNKRSRKILGLMEKVYSGK